MHGEQAPPAGRGRPRAGRPASPSISSARAIDVTRTGDGEEALILVDEVKPDVILLDWMIEGISGIEVCRRLRRRATTANVPIIMLTARGEESDRIRGFETGADDYVTKPFSPRELVARVGAVLRRVRPGAGRRAAGLCRHRDGRRRAPRAPRRRAGRARPDRVPPAAAFPRASRPRVLARAAARRGLGRTIPTSTRAPSTSTSGACARRSMRAAAPTSSAPSARPATRSIPSIESPGIHSHGTETNPSNNRRHPGLAPDSADASTVRISGYRTWF